MSVPISKMVILTPYCALDKAHVVQVGAGGGMNEGGKRSTISDK